MFKLIKAWRKGRAQRAAECTILESRFEQFAKETQPLVPRAPKNPEAALYRYCWKRSSVLQQLFSELPGYEVEAELYAGLSELAAKKYQRICPQNAYGPIHLVLGVRAHEQMRAQEIRRLCPPNEVPAPTDKELSCIYIGIDNKDGKPYIGQTIFSPEIRWKEHRLAGSGPFKTGAAYAQWRVLEEKVPHSALNERESYYIGFYDAYEQGHNDNRGNDWKAYERGKREIPLGR